MYFCNSIYIRKSLWNSLCNGSCINLDTDISLLGKTSTQVIFDINGFKRKTKWKHVRVCLIIRVDARRILIGLET